jgi:hypothetical protein
MLKQINQQNMISRKKVYRCLLYLNCTEHFGHLRCRHRDINAALDIREIGMWYLKTCYRWILHKQHNNEMWNNAIWMSDEQSQYSVNFSTEIKV